MRKVLLITIVLGTLFNPVLAENPDNPLVQKTGQYVDRSTDSGFISNSSNTWTVVFDQMLHVEGAEWIRVFFGDVSLNQGFVRITSLEDGESQELNAVDMERWENASAYFNGNTLHLELVAGPGSTDNRVVVDHLYVDTPVEASGLCGICGSDDRVPSSEDWVARLLDIGCTGSIWTTRRGCIITAGHCRGPNQVAQFRVPPSNSNCSLNHPPVSDQFPLGGWLSANAGPGADWAVTRCGDNDQGQTPYERYGEMRPIAPVPANQGDILDMRGHGISSICTRTRVQQTAFGPVAQRARTYYRITIDLTTGNSGSPLTKNDEIVGVVTHCPCINWASRIDISDFADARDIMCGIPPRSELPFFDDFPEFPINRELWQLLGATLGNNPPGDPPSEPFVVILDGTGGACRTCGQGDRISTALLDTSDVDELIIKYWYLQSGPISGEDLLVEYNNSSGSWSLAVLHPGSDPDMTEFVQNTYVFPENAKHQNFLVRFRTRSHTSTDDWYLDDIEIFAGGCNRDPQWFCDGDVDGDGQVNPVDSGLIQAAFGSTDQGDLCQYDMDCDEQINPVDSGIVQALFGTCEAPREVCP